MVSHPPKPSHTHSTSRSSQHGSTGSNAGTPSHSKKSSTSSNHRAPSRDARPSREGTAQRAAQDVAGLKDYQLGDCLGKGAFGSVYRALNWSTGETVAVKQVRTESLGASELKNIKMEIDLLKNLNHQNIVKYHGSVTGPDALYIILE
jgi:serine/threonine protein kinase